MRKRRRRRKQGDEEAAAETEVAYNGWLQKLRDLCVRKGDKH